MDAKPLTLLRRGEVERRTGLPTSSLYQLVADGVPRARSGCPAVGSRGLNTKSNHSFKRELPNATRRRRSHDHRRRHRHA
jgi:hypothetical protein